MLQLKSRQDNELKQKRILKEVLDSLS